MHRYSKKGKIIFLILIILVIILKITDLGYLKFDEVSLDIISIPIILGTLIFGLPEGLLLSFIYGLLSLIKSFSFPSESIEAAFSNPLVSIVPRLLIPLIVWFIFKSIKKVIDDGSLSSKIICSGFTSIFGVLANLIFVVLALIILYPKKMGINHNIDAIFIKLSNDMFINLLIEIIVTVFLVAIVYPLILKFLGTETEKQNKELKRTFQKWLLAFFTGFFAISITFFYYIETEQEQINSYNLLNEKCKDLSVIIRNGEEYLNTELLTVGDTGAVFIFEDRYKRPLIKKDYELRVQNIIKDEDIILVGGPDRAHYGYKFRYFANNATFLHDNEHVFYTEINGIGQRAILMSPGMEYSQLILATIPDTETYGTRNKLSLVVVVGIIVFFLIMFIIISRIININIVRKIQEVNKSLSRIQNGDLNETISIYSNTEFRDLSNGINSTVSALKNAMVDIEDRIAQEMDIARTIQLSSLPTNEQISAITSEVDVFAFMQPAKEVGGDFYDYYKLDNNRIVFLVADVSGKGISAAMFMMKAKTLIKGYVEQNLQPCKVIEMANEELCRNNDAEMFVTCWIGILDMLTHKLTFVNAGHNPPLIRRQNKQFEFLKTKPCFVIAGMEGIRYRQEEIILEPGDSLFLYTDGITEATNSKNELYGENRLITALNNNACDSAEQLCKEILNDNETFVNSAPQFDDMTILCMKLISDKEICVVPNNDSVIEVTNFVEKLLISENIDKKIINKINICIDEICSNIYRYSTASILKVSCQVTEKSVALTFMDDGIPYNPLLNKEPNISLNVEERLEGGLGIFMVKKIVDNIYYGYDNSLNILKIEKKLV